MLRFTGMSEKAPDHHPRVFSNISMRPNGCIGFNEAWSNQVNMWLDNRSFFDVNRAFSLIDGNELNALWML